MANVITEEVSSLDVITPDMFDGKDFDMQCIQANFYKGAPPQWVNFYVAEKNEMAFVKRDGYTEIKDRIKSQKGRTVSMVTLLHETGSGGSTLAMQVLWDLQKTFQCAKLATEAVLDANVISKDVIKLVPKKGRGKPVLLLLDNTDMLKDNLSKTLQKRLIKELNEINNNQSVIILKCIRKSELADSDKKSDQKEIILLRAKQTREQEEFDQHQKRIIEQYPNEHQMFHGFNIVHGGIDSEMYTADVCNVIVPPKRNGRPRKDQLFAILTLVQKYAPGSDFLLGQCEKFLHRSNNIRKPPAFEVQMGTFSDLLVTYTNFENNLEYVHVAHPMIGDKCFELFSDHGLNMGEVTYLFLQNFCAEHVSLIQTKTMLTMRERNKNGDKAKFPKLIQDIYRYNREGGRMCTRLLKKASEIYKDRPTFPQALARCYYLMVDKELSVSQYQKDYINAERWAKEAINRHPNNSFIMDTLGQAYKHQLIHHMKKDPELSKVLSLGSLAIKTFQKEEMAAEKEEAEEKVKEPNVNTSPTFNMRGKLGYLQVANELYDTLEKNKNSREIDESMKCKCRNLSMNIKAGVKKRFGFFEKYLTYSKQDFLMDDPHYIRAYADGCYTKYVGRPSRILKIEDILRKYKVVDSPELYHLNLLQSAEGQEFSEVVKKMRQAYENMYEKYFRSRYLVPLYMKTTDGWKTLEELGLEPKEIEKGICSDQNEGGDTTSTDGNNTEQRLAQLMRIEGKITKPNISGSIEGTSIPVEPHNMERALRDGPISFYLGFNIKGPVAFNIKYEKEL